jgi:RNA polymerase sigma factor (TIGR02999 family)
MRQLWNWVVDDVKQEEITQILADFSGTDDETALAKLLPLIYPELRSLARSYLAQERPDHTLQATALVHEAYLRLGSGSGPWENRGHFFRVAAKTMRRLLVNHAIMKKAAKRGGAQNRIELDEITAAIPDRDVDLVDLDEALTKLKSLGAQKAKIVELRFFGGCSIEETAEVLGLSARTVDRQWRFARAWLRDQLDETTGL